MEVFLKESAGFNGDVVDISFYKKATKERVALLYKPCSSEEWEVDFFGTQKDERTFYFLGKEAAKEFALNWLQAEVVDGL